MAEIPQELIDLFVEEGVDYIAAKIGETAVENSVLYQAFHFLITKGVEFVLPTVLSASCGDPNGFALGLIRKDLSKIQKDLDDFREIPFQTIKYLVEDAKDDCNDEVNHVDAYEKFKAIEKKAFKAIFSSKKFENKIQAAEIAVLAKSYIKRFDPESSIFLELHQIDQARKKSLSQQIQRLLNEFIHMPEYKEALEKAKGAWYRLEKTKQENHEFVDRVDALKVSIYANSVLCLNTIQAARVRQHDEGLVLSKTWMLNRDWIPEGERFALEISFTEKEICDLFEDEELEEQQEEEEQENQDEDDEELENEESSFEEEEEEDEKDEDEFWNSKPNYFEEESEDEQLSDDEDNVDEEGEVTDNEEEDGDENILEHMNETCSIEKLGSSDSPFSIFTNLHGTVFVKSGMQCKLLINGEDQQENESETTQNCWKIENPDETLKIEFLATKENIQSRSKLTCKKLNLTEEVGAELVNLLKKTDGKSAQRAETYIKCGTVTNISWRIHWSEILRSLDTGKDLQSPLFTPLPVEDNQPHMRAIIAGDKNKIGLKKVSWKGLQTSLVVGMLMWKEENPEVNVVGNLRTLKKGVKDLQVKDINWDDFGDEEFVRVDVFLFSSLVCQTE